MRALPVLSVGGLAAFLVIYWLMPYDTAQLQDDRMLSSMPNATPGAPGGRAEGGAREREVQALVGRILNRPLFNPDRRPAAGSAGDGPANLPRLTAVLVSNRGKTAIFAAGADGKPVTLSEGGRVGDYTVRAIGAGQVTVAGPEGMQVVRPTPDGGAPAVEPALAGRPSIRDLLRQGSPPIVLPGLQTPVQR